VARSTLNFFPSLLLLAGALGCSDSSDELSGGPIDAGLADSSERFDAQLEPTDAATNGGRPDAAATDGAPEVDAGPADLGPPARTLEQAAIVPERDRESLLLLPGFESNALNGSWLALPLSAAVAAPTFDRRFWSNAPTARPEVAILPGTDDYPPGAGLYGFGVSPGTDVEGEIWLGLEEPEEADWAALTTGLIVYAQALGPAIVFFEGRPEDEVEALGRIWRPFGGRAGVPVFGHIVIGVQNEGASEVWINGPRAASVSDDGTTRLWDTASGRALASIPGRGLPAFSGEGTLLATPDRNGAIRLWAMARLNGFLSHGDERQWYAELSRRAQRHLGYRFDGFHLVPQARTQILTETRSRDQRRPLETSLIEWLSQGLE